MNNNYKINKKNKSYPTNNCSDVECIICFYEISPLRPYYYCKICNTAVHHTCYKNWWETQANKNKTCAHCQKKNNLLLFKPHSPKKTSLLCRIFSCFCI